MCECSPSTNVVCQTQQTVTVTQPTCQLLPDLTNQINPYFDATNNISYWTYKVIPQCTINTFVLPLTVYIPIYENIGMEMLTVSELIQGCGRFEDVAYDFTSPTGVTPPAGFKYVRIQINGRYTRGDLVLYRFNILGNYPEIQQTVYVDTSDGLRTFSAGYAVPGIPVIPRLAITKNSEVTINNNQATIEYTVVLSNTGNTDLTNVMYIDTINYNGSNLVIGTVTVNTPGVTVDTSMQGIIRLMGSFPEILMGEAVTITYTVPIVSFSTPDTYVLASETTGTSPEAQASLDTDVSIPVVEFTTATVCNILSSDRASFTVTINSVPNSPMSNIVITDTIIVPSRVSIQFTNLGNCTATFSDTGDPVDLNTDITGRQINIVCQATVPSNGSMNYNFVFRVVSSSANQQLTNPISNSIETVVLQVVNSQVFLGASPLPNTANVNVTVDSICENVCNT